MRPLLLEHQPHRSLAHFAWIPVLFSHGSILSRLGASGNSGAIQLQHRGILLVVAAERKLTFQDGVIAPNRFVV
jgi:hypothetical protein